MKRQYEQKGLEIILVGAPGAIDKVLSNITLANFVSDCELSEIPLIWNKSGLKVSAKYGVAVLPTTFSVSKNGIVKKKWVSVVLPAELAFAIEEELK